MLGLGCDQCNAFLVRTDAPQFQSSDEVIAWLNGKNRRGAEGKLHKSVRPGGVQAVQATPHRST